MIYDKEIQEIEEKGIEKLQAGELNEAVELFREAIQKGSPNFKSRLLLTKILSDLERNEQNRDLENEADAEADL